MINRATAAIPILSLFELANTSKINGQNCRKATLRVLNAIKITAKGDCLDGIVNLSSNFRYFKLLLSLGSSSFHHILYTICENTKDLRENSFFHLCEMPSALFRHFLIIPLPHFQHVSSSISLPWSAVLIRVLVLVSWCHYYAHQL